MIERIYILSYHHQIGSMNYYPLFRVRSWKNGVCYMSFDILNVLVVLVTSLFVPDCLYILPSDPSFCYKFLRVLYGGVRVLLIADPGSAWHLCGARALAWPVLTSCFELWEGPTGLWALDTLAEVWHSLSTGSVGRPRRQLYMDRGPGPSGRYIIPSRQRVHTAVDYKENCSSPAIYHGQVKWVSDTVYRPVSYRGLWGPYNP